MRYINDELWKKEISQKDWYLRLDPEFKRLENIQKDLSKEDEEELKEELYSYIERDLENGSIQLNQNYHDWDDERKPIDTIVIHHTSNDRSLTLSRLNAKHMHRLYRPFFTNPNEDNKAIKGEAISSGHFTNGAQVFYGYHWLVRLDGSQEKLLADNYVGWHAGNWDINTRSVAICIDGNFETSSPDIKVLKSISQLIKDNYKKVPIENIFGHNEVNKNTVCPGNGFIDGWKSTLINLIKEYQ
jgi:hypothetical protein